MVDRMLGGGSLDELPGTLPVVVGIPTLFGAEGGSAMNAQLLAWAQWPTLWGLVCGVIAIGPFGCMPNRLSESILNETMNSRDKIATEPDNAALRAVLTDIDELPFLAIESDGSPFPQLINAKLETFCLRAERLHQRILDAHHGPR